MNKIEVCITPATYNIYHNPEAIVVVADILRATSAICSAFMNGVKEILPVGTIEEAKAHKINGAIVAAERDGLVLDFADFGNSPFNFSKENVGNKSIVYSTTNGTNAINLAKESHKVVVGSFLNLQATADWIAKQERDVVVLCAGWKNRFSLEDTVYGGALAQILIDSKKFTTICDSVTAALDLWEKAEPNLNQYMLKAAQKGRLAKNGLDDCFEFCHTLNQTNVIPVLDNNKLIPLQEN